MYIFMLISCFFYNINKKKLNIFNLIGKETGIWYRKQHIGRNSLSGFMKDLVHKTGIEVDGLLTNHFGCKTAAQLMQDKDIEEQVIMNITGHRSVNAVRKYKIPNDQQKMDTLQNLISTYGDVTNQEIPNNQLIQDLNERPLRNSQITNLELQNLPIYTSPDNIQ